MKQRSIEQRIWALYYRFPEIIDDQKLLEFIFLNEIDINYMTNLSYSGLKLKITDMSMSFNDYHHGPSIESITRAIRRVRQELRKINKLNEAIDLQRLKKETEYIEDYGQRKIF